MSAPGSELAQGKKKYDCLRKFSKTYSEVQNATEPLSLQPCRGAGKYEHVYQRGGIFSLEAALFLWPGKPIRLKEALAAADQLSH